MRRQMMAMDTKTNLTQEWLDKYESVKDKLQCKVDLDEYFTKSKVANMDVAILDSWTGTLSYRSNYCLRSIH